MPSLFIAAPIIGDLEGFKFRYNRDNTFCRICGAIFQSDLDRLDHPNDFEAFEARMLRMEWSHKHAKTHTAREHLNLQRSGLFLTPEATERLVPFGIIPVQDIVFSDESEHAGLVAPRAPRNDAECA